MILALCPNPSVDTVLWLDQLTPGKMMRAQKEMRYPGGKGVHVAAALCELGAESAVLGFWAGPTGEWMRQECARLKVPVYGPEVSGWTRTCLTIRGHPPFDETEILEQGPKISAAERDQFFAQLDAQLARATLVTMSGSVPMGIDEIFYATCVERCKAQGIPVILDFTGPALERTLTLEPLGLHLNFTEGKSQTGEEDPRKILRALSRSVQNVALTCGAEGLWWAARGQVWRARLRLEQVLGTVGSGDCLVAGMAYALSKKASVEDTLRWATACGAANCLREELGLIYKRDVDKLFSQVAVEQIE